MTPPEKLKIARWLYAEVVKLKNRPHYPAIAESVVKLEAIAWKLKQEADPEGLASWAEDSKEDDA